MRFDVEWLGAPGVADPLLAATWARLRIEAGGADVIDLLHLPSNNRRSAVYGPILPVVEWFVENWWHLLYEPSPASPLLPGRSASRWNFRWVKRHNLLAAREGTALPDVVLARDGADIVVRWFPDGHQEGPRRVRFVGDGVARVPAPAFEEAVTALVESTLARLNEIAPGDESVQGLAAAWAAILRSDAEERDLCCSLARLGVDPYDPSEANDSLVELVDGINVEFREAAEIRDDLFDGTPPALLADAVEWVRQNLPSPDVVRAAPVHPTLPPAWAASAHQTGYQFAHRVRSELMGFSPKDPIADLQDVLVERLGWDADPVVIREGNIGLDGLVRLSPGAGKPHLVEPGGRKLWGERFLLARSAFFAATASLGSGRLLTKAVTRHQRTARAFAAELLAPASALMDVVSGVVSTDEVLALSEKFGVSSMLIEHQIKNHGLGYVAA
ncbi:MAG: hypothetical protein FJ087_04245 [Deltaproteobacteria bacterium]|nr:hypothetical protein [Deltaproteobacteria bacterium]